MTVTLISSTEATDFPPRFDSSLRDLEAWGCELKTTSLELPKTVSEEQWLNVGHTLAGFGTRLSWWLGDWWLFGHRYGERAALLRGDSWHGPAYSTCANAATVCRAFETSRRREVLSFSHHAAVASLSRKDADSLLDWAAESIKTTGRRRSVSQLEKEIDRREEFKRTREKKVVDPKVIALPAVPSGPRVVAAYPLPIPPRFLNTQSDYAHVTAVPVNDDTRRCTLALNRLSRILTMWMNEDIRNELLDLQQILGG